MIRKAALLATSLAILPFSAAQALDVPPGDCGTQLTSGDVCLELSDFDVYSLATLQAIQSQFNLFTGFDFVEKPNEADVVIFDSDGNGTGNQGAGTDIDDAYEAVKGQGPTGDNMMYLMTSPDSSAGGSPASTWRSPAS